MHYMIVEHFRNGDPLPVYRRFATRAASRPRACGTSRAG